MFEVENAGNRKMINSVKDGDSFNNTTFENSVANGTFEAGLIFTADQIVAASNGYNENGFVGVGAVISINQQQAEVLNNYGHPVLVFDVTWADGSYLSQGKLLIITLDDTFTNNAIIIPEYDDGYSVCEESAIWNMPVIITNFIIGGNI